jgi:hypothetical protein
MDDGVRVVGGAAGARVCLPAASPIGRRYCTNTEGSPAGGHRFRGCRHDRPHHVRTVMVSYGIMVWRVPVLTWCPPTLELGVCRSRFDAAVHAMTRPVRRSSRYPVRSPIPQPLVLVPAHDPTPVIPERHGMLHPSPRYLSRFHSVIPIIWSYVFLALYAPDRAIRRNAARVCAMMMVTHGTHMARSSHALRVVWEWIMEDIPSRGMVARSLVALAAPHDRRWIEEAIGAVRDPMARLTLCRHLSPSLLPRLRSIVTNSLGSRAESIRTAAITTLCAWVGDPDPETAAWATQVLTHISTSKDYLPLGVRLTMLDTLARYAPGAWITHPNVRYDLAEALGSSYANRTWADIAWSVVERCPVLWTDMMDTILTVIRRDEYFGSRAASFVCRMVRQSGDLQRVVWWREVLRTLLTDGSTLPPAQMIAVHQINEAAHWELAATVFVELIRDLVDSLPTWEVDTIRALVGGPWRSHIVTFVLDRLTVSVSSHGASSADDMPIPGWATGCPAHRRIQCLIDIMIAAWGSGDEARLLRLLRDHPDILPDPEARCIVLSYGISTAASDQVWAVLHRDFPAYADKYLRCRLYRLSEPSDVHPGGRLPAHLLRLVEHAVMRHPELVTPALMQRVWDTDPTTAYTLIDSLIRSLHHVVDGKEMVGFVRSLAAGWGTGNDSAIGSTIHWVIHHCLSGERERDRLLVHAILESITDGIGRGDQHVLLDLLVQIMARHDVVPAVESVLGGHTIRTAWERGYGVMARWLVQTLLPRSVPDRIRDLIAVLRIGWAYEDHRWIRTVLHTVLMMALRTYQESWDPVAATIMCHALTALGNGWGRGGDPEILRIINETWRGITATRDRHRCERDPSNQCVDALMTTLGAVIIDGIAWIDASAGASILSSMNAMHPTWVLDSIARWWMDRGTPTCHPHAVGR